MRIAIKCIVEGIAPQAPQAGIYVALEELRLRAKGANFSSVRPRATLRVRRATTLPAAISDFSPRSVNDI